jgi:hypothetical protein
MAWFEITEKTLNLKFKLNQACIPWIHCKYGLMTLYIHCRCYSDTRSATPSRCRAAPPLPLPATAPPLSCRPSTLPHCCTWASPHWWAGQRMVAGRVGSGRHPCLAGRVSEWARGGISRAGECSCCVREWWMEHGWPDVASYFVGCFMPMKICDNFKKLVAGDFFVGFYWPTK